VRAISACSCSCRVRFYETGQRAARRSREAEGCAGSRAGRLGSRASSRENDDEEGGDEINERDTWLLEARASRGLGAARTMRSITSPSTRRSRASSLRGGGGRGKASGEVSVCRGVPCTVRRVNLIFPASRARPRRDDPRESRRGVVRGDRDRTSRARGALRGAPACRTPSSCAPNTARGTTTQYAQVTP
jgi:hypothetical protein